MTLTRCFIESRLQSIAISVVVRGILFEAVGRKQLLIYLANKTDEDKKQQFGKEVIDTVNGNFHVENYLKSLPSTEEV